MLCKFQITLNNDKVYNLQSKNKKNWLNILIDSPAHSSILGIMTDFLKGPKYIDQ